MKGELSIENRIETNGTKYNIDPRTGEIQEMVTVSVPVGSSIRTPEQYRAAKEWFELEKEKWINHGKKIGTRRELGVFYFVFANDAFCDIAPQTATRLIMLCSYLQDNKFMLSSKEPMRKSDIKKVLGLSKSATRDFLLEVKDRYIIETDGELFVNPERKIFRGRMPRDEKFIQYQKVYIQTIRDLYRKTDSRKHGQLGYVFKLLPFINLEFNILCSDVFTDDIEQVHPLTLKEVCDIIEYDETQSSRLEKALKSFEFQHRGKDEYLISFVKNGSTTGEQIFINPRVIYNGKDYKRVEILGAFYN